MTAEPPLPVESVPLADIQQHAFEVLCALVDFLDAEGIGYFLVGGTLLGALRHRGFIPWDDDIDIVVPRADYRRLLQSLPRLPSGLKAAHPGNDPRTPYPFLVVSDAASSLVIDYARPYDRGIGVDVFPLDAAPRAGWRQALLWRGITLLKAMTMNKQGGYYRRRIPWQQRPRFMLLALLNALVPRRALFRAYDAWVSNAGNGSSLPLGNLYGLYGRRELVPARVFGAGSTVHFQGRMFRAPIQPEEYLQAVYGDFMHLPPASDRHSGHRIRAVSIATACISGRAQ